jgi:nitroreductase
MELTEAIRGRRSVREYVTTPLDRREVESLLDAAVQAPSAMNRQSWAFVVIEDQALLTRYSDQIKPLVLASLAGSPLPLDFAKTLADPAYHIFHGAPALIVIHARTEDPFATIDCCLAGQNLMLAAHDRGLGSCWIGLAEGWLNRDAVKDELSVPRTWTAIAPIIVGHPKGIAAPVPRRRPEVIWRE